MFVVRYFKAASADIELYRSKLVHFLHFTDFKGINVFIVLGRRTNAITEKSSQVSIAGVPTIGHSAPFEITTRKTPLFLNSHFQTGLPGLWSALFVRAVPEFPFDQRTIDKIRQR
jgi:hypothetical protein